ncbi:unnamed protein product [Pedinophyceae sp. YPF-701]|nr:unnamed protein product [Pedinophyceae sp. YPF-701]
MANFAANAGASAARAGGGRLDVVNEFLIAADGDDLIRPVAVLRVPEALNGSRLQHAVDAVCGSNPQLRVQVDAERGAYAFAEAPQPPRVIVHAKGRASGLSGYESSSSSSDSDYELPGCGQAATRAGDGGDYFTGAEDWVIEDETFSPWLAELARELATGMSTADTASGVPFRLVAVVDHTARTTALVMRAHHALLDGWSMGSILLAICAEYDKPHRGRRISSAAVWEAMSPGQLPCRPQPILQLQRTADAHLRTWQARLRVVLLAALHLAWCSLGLLLGALNLYARAQPSGATLPDTPTFQRIQTAQQSTPRLRRVVAMPGRPKKVATPPPTPANAPAPLRSSAAIAQHPPAPDSPRRGSTGMIRIPLARRRLNQLFTAAASPAAPRAAGATGSDAAPAQAHALTALDIWRSRWHGEPVAPPQQPQAAPAPPAAPAGRDTAALLSSHSLASTPVVSLAPSRPGTPPPVALPVSSKTAQDPGDVLSWCTRALSTEQSVVPPVRSLSESDVAIHLLASASTEEGQQTVLRGAAGIPAEREGPAKHRSTPSLGEWDRTPSSSEPSLRRSSEQSTDGVASDAPAVPPGRGAYVAATLSQDATSRVRAAARRNHAKMGAVINAAALRALAVVLRERSACGDVVLPGTLRRALSTLVLGSPSTCLMLEAVNMRGRLGDPPAPAVMLGSGALLTAHPAPLEHGGSSGPSGLWRHAARCAQCTALAMRIGLAAANLTWIWLAQLLYGVRDAGIRHFYAAAAAARLAPVGALGLFVDNLGDLDRNPATRLAIPRRWRNRFCGVGVSAGANSAALALAAWAHVFVGSSGGRLCAVAHAPPGRLRRAELRRLLALFCRELLDASRE